MTDKKIPPWAVEWTIKRQKGKWHYVFSEWVIALGLPMYFGTMIVNPPNEKSLFYNYPLFPYSHYLSGLFLSFIIFLLCGLYIWYTHERNFSEILETNPELNVLLLIENINMQQDSTEIIVIPDKKTIVFNRIKYAWLLGILLGTINLINNEFFDSVFIFLMALGIYKKSRICACLMFINYTLARIIIFTSDTLHGQELIIVIMIVIVCSYIFLQGMIATFIYHKQIK
jgi:hypothetical protein